MQIYPIYARFHSGELWFIRRRNEEHSISRTFGFHLIYNKPRSTYGTERSSEGMTAQVGYRDCRSDKGEEASDYTEDHRPMIDSPFFRSLHSML